MKAIELYKQEIQKQKSLPEKIATARRWLRDAKQGRFIPNSIKGLERIVPRGYNYFTKPGGNIDQSLIEYIQADLEYRENLVEGKQEFSDLSEPTQEVGKIRWTGETSKLLVALFELLHEAGLIDNKSFKETAANMARHFTNRGSEISNDGVRQYRNKAYKDEKIKIINELFHRLDDAAGSLTDEGVTPS